MPSKIVSLPKKSRTLGSKWSKTQLLLKHSRLRQFVPPTLLYSYDNLRKMLDRHKMVYVKPVKGTGGNGVIRVMKVNDHKYGYHAGTTPYYYSSYADLYKALAKCKLKREYIVQQGIHLLTFRKRIFDLRIMIQKNEKNKWECSGYIGRIAHPRKIVTNFHSNGTPLPLETLLEAYLQGDKKKNYIRSLTNLGHEVTKEFEKRNAGYKEIGLDIGLDAALKPWIIEVNTRPDAYIFNQLKDKRMFRRIMQLKKRNGLRV